MVLTLSWGSVFPLITPALLSEHTLTAGLCGMPWGPLNGMELLEVAVRSPLVAVKAEFTGVGPRGPGCLHSGALPSAICR